MLRDACGFRKIYIATGRTDLRKGIDGLAAIIKLQFHLEPRDRNTLFLFCGTRTDRIKGLLWEGDGWLLLYKTDRGRRLLLAKNHTGSPCRHTGTVPGPDAWVRDCSQASHPGYRGPSPGFVIVQSAEIYPALQMPGIVRTRDPAVVIHHCVEYTCRRIPITRKSVHKEAGIPLEPIGFLYNRCLPLPVIHRQNDGCRKTADSP